MGGVGNGAAEEDSHRDINPGMAAMWVLTTQLWGGAMWFGAPFTMQLRKQGRGRRTRDGDNARPCREGKG